MSPFPGRAPSLFGLRPYLLLALLAAALPLSAADARAQGSGANMGGNGGRHVIRGRIVFPSGRRADVGLKITLESSGASGNLSVISDANGSFTFPALRPGSYTVIVDGGDDFVTTTERVVIESEGNARGGVVAVAASRPYTVQVYLQLKNEYDMSSRPGVLNAALAGVPKAAVGLYEKALEAARKGDSRKAVEQLKGALALHAEFPLALSQLGVQYMKLKEMALASDALRSALKLMPEDYATLLTYGMVLFERQQFSDAEEQFRKALSKNASSPSAHYYLGLTLLKRNGYEEAERELLSAINSGGESIALAYYYLGGLYWSRHEYRKAADALETYLRLAPQAENATRLRATIKELRAKG
jgi:Tfp pilus assembly protein PilF